MTTRNKLSLALKEIVATLESDLAWLTPDGKRQFLQQMRRERDETVLIFLETAPDASTVDAAVLRRVAASLRADGDPERLALAARLEARLSEE